MKRNLSLILPVIYLCGHGFAVKADTFGSGANTFQIDFVTIGNPGNASDTTGTPNPAGSVSYRYRIGKFEISEQMIDKANAEGGLEITKNTRGPDKPATYITWFEAAKFVNWLNTSTGGVPAYKFDSAGNFKLWMPSDPGYDPNNLFRNTLASYFLPSVNEWYKAAYYEPASGTYFDYPTGSNTPPIAVASGTSVGTAVYQQDRLTLPADITLAGGLSPYGTMAQAGNAYEWEETDYDLANNSDFGDHGHRGGSWRSHAFEGSAFLRRRGPGAASSLEWTGFRVAAIVPEPSSLALIASACFGLLGFRRLRYLRTEL